MKIIIKRIKVDFISWQRISAVIGGFVKQIFKFFGEEIMHLVMVYNAHSQKMLENSGIKGVHYTHKITVFLSYK